MIRHTVLFKLKPNVSKLDVETIFTDIIGLTGKLDGILAITGGTCYFYDHNKESQPFTHGFSIDFQDEIARDSFLHDSVTNPVKDKILKMSAGGANGIIGFDFGEWG